MLGFYLDFPNCDHLATAEVTENVGTVIHKSGMKIISWEAESRPSTGHIHSPLVEGVGELTRVPSNSKPNPTGYQDIM